MNTPPTVGEAILYWPTGNTTSYPGTVTEVIDATHVKITLDAPIAVHYVGDINAPRPLNCATPPA